MCLIIIRHLMENFKNNPDNYQKLKDYYEELSQTENNNQQIDQLF